MKCDFCSKEKKTKPIYGDLRICRECKIDEDKKAEIASSIEG